MPGRKLRWIALTMCVAACMAPCGVSWADEAPPLSPVPSEEPESAHEPTLYDKIDINLLDVERLRTVIEGQGEPKRIRLSLQDCVQTALRSNPDVLVVSYEPLKSAADVLAAKGEFDPVANGSATYIYASQQTSPEYQTFSGISAYEEYRTNSEFSVGGKLHWGTLYNASFTLNKEETTFNNFIEEWQGGLTLTLTQPLLRGRGKKANLARIRLAKNTEEISASQVELAILNAVAQVIKSYWDLVGALENLRVVEQSLENARRLLETSERRLEIGVGAAIEVLQSKAGIATRQSELLSARSRVADAEDMLKQLLNLREGDVFSASRIVPTDRPLVTEFTADDFAEVEQEFAESIALALEHRPEIQSDMLTIANAEIERKRSSNDLLPKLDVTGSVYQGGRDHYMRRVFDGVRERSDNAYNIGVQGSIPLGNRAARGAYQRAELALRQAKQSLEKTRQEVMLNVRLALRSLHTSQVLVESNRQARLLQEANVTAEEKRLLLGTSTSYRVLQVQEDLTRAQTQEVQAHVAYEQALTELRLAEGTLLKSLGIALEEEPEGEKPIGFWRSIYPKTPPEPELTAPAEEDEESEQ